MLIFIAILGLSLLIFIHELGHFLAAKAFGMRAEKFYIGFPPAAIKKKIGETEYGIGVVPLGGYVKISGMTREEEVPEEVVPRAYYSKPIWQRIITISAGSAMNVLLAVVLFFIFHLQPVPIEEYSVREVVADTGASQAGLKPGDKLLALDGVSYGVNYEDVDRLQQAIQEHPDASVTLTVEREDGQRLDLPATIGVNPETGRGQLGIYWKGTKVGEEQLTVSEAATSSIGDIGMITRLVFDAFSQVFADRGEQLASPIGIVAFSSETIKLGWDVYLRVLGFISIQLAILNMLPLLPLDGGHVLFNVIEKIMGRPLNREAFERISFVGLMLFVILFVVGFMNDIQRLIGPGFRLEP